MHRLTRAFTGTTFWIVLSALLLGFFIGQVRLGGPASAQVETPSSSDATATREAELEELERLRAQVAGSPVAVVCTPAATATATPTPAPTASPTPVPPVAAGEPVPYAEDWTVTVTGLSLQPTIRTQTATGVFAAVDLMILNEGTAQRPIPLNEFVLVDNEGRTFTPSVAATVDASLAGGVSGWNAPVAPGIATDAVVVFDVAPDAEGPFILQSTEDPTFRVEVSQERSG
ncbi:MAG: DUF4352 domain-containing protein [Chloroflexota bacterium]|nr:DUF4352 domain-containing protein [Chloroflexota bacterium]